MMNRNAIVINILCKLKLKIKRTFFPLQKNRIQSHSLRILFYIFLFFIEYNGNRVRLAFPLADNKSGALRWLRQIDLPSRL